jgi:hypothetical protein
VAEETKNYGRPDKGNGSIPVAVVASLVSAVLAGGGGTYAAGASVSATLREGMVRLEGQVQAMREELRRQGDDAKAAVLRMDTRTEGIDSRLRAAELKLERFGPQPPR